MDDIVDMKEALPNTGSNSFSSGRKPENRPNLKETMYNTMQDIKEYLSNPNHIADA